MERAEQYATSWTPQGHSKAEERKEGIKTERKGKKGEREDDAAEDKGEVKSREKKNSQERAEQYVQADSKEGKEREGKGKGESKKEGEGKGRSRPVSEKGKRWSKKEGEIPKSELNNMPKLTRREERNKKYRNDSEITDRADPKSRRGRKNVKRSTIEKMSHFEQAKAAE